MYLDTYKIPVQWIHKVLYATQNATPLAGLCFKSSIALIQMKPQQSQRSPWQHVYTLVCMCVYVSLFEKAIGSKCQTNPQCSAAGGERCLCFLISLLRKKPVALSHVFSASIDNMTLTVVLV